MFQHSVANEPLAERMRPTSLADFIGQKHLTGQGGVIAGVVEQKKPHSLIFWGPPGVGKTTLAQLIAHDAGLPYFTLSAIDSGVKEVRHVIDLAQKSGKAVLFIDEIHRFNKAQQDSLLAAVEKGTVCLIGATTENPSFEVIGALLSRCRVYVLNALSADELKQIALQAMEKDTWLRGQNLQIAEWEALLRLSGGDARKLLNIIELLADSITTPVKIIYNDITQKIVQQNAYKFDKDGEQHYDIISAFIKSIRGSDPNAAVYYLARMIAGGEDPKFIARRMVILASEDIGNANPNALLLATSCFQAVNLIGYPECRIILSHTAIYLATSAKSNSVYMAIENALALVKQSGDLAVPLPIRNAPTSLMKELNYGKGYEYAHDYEGNFIAQEFLPTEIAGTKLYEPSNNAAEAKTRAYLRQCWKEKYGY